jgi:serine/threonine protein kinase
MQKGKFSSPYSLVREPLESAKTHALYDARNKQTGEIWLARVLHHQPLLELEMQEHAEYNEEVLENLKEKEHVIYVAEIFLKGQETYIIQEKYDARLSALLRSKGTLPPQEIERILRDVFEGICDIYEERYVHCNLRS